MVFKIFANMFNQQRIASLHQHPTPFYLYDLGLLDKTLAAMKAASSKYIFHVHYALKANSNREILSHILKSGMGERISRFEFALRA